MVLENHSSAGLAPCEGAIADKVAARRDADSKKLCEQGQLHELEVRIKCFSDADLDHQSVECNDVEER